MTKIPLDEPYEKWAQKKRPVWPLLKHRLQVAALGAAFGASLGLVVVGVLLLDDRVTSVEPLWTLIGLAATGAVSALIQSWRE